MKKEHKIKGIIIPPEGLLLDTGKLYLGRTLEYTKISMYPCLKEDPHRRLGLFIHVTTEFGDVGDILFFSILSDYV